jgi:hypothetical protein
MKAAFWMIFKQKTAKLTEHEKEKVKSPQHFVKSWGARTLLGFLRS